MLTLTRMTKTEPAYVPPSWSSGTDQEIIRALQKHYDPNDPLDLHEYWNVGEERIIHLSSFQGLTESEGTYPTQDVVFVLSHVGGKMLSDNVTECAFQVDQKSALQNDYNGAVINTVNSNVGGYAQSPRHDWFNNQYYNAIPGSIREIFKQVYNHSGIGEGYANTTTTLDYFSLRAEIEMGSNDGQHYSSAYAAEGSQIEWFEDSAVKAASGRAQVWTRSACTLDYNDRYYCNFFSGGNSQNGWGAATPLRLAPFGAI